MASSLTDHLVTANPFLDVDSVSAIVHVPAFNHSMSSLPSGSASSLLPIQFLKITDPRSQLYSVTINITHQASLEKIKPFPKAGSRKSVKGYKCQGTPILTDTPVQNGLNKLQEMKKKSQSLKTKNQEALCQKKSSWREKENLISKVIKEKL